MDFVGHNKHRDCARRRRVRGYVQGEVVYLIGPAEHEGSHGDNGGYEKGFRRQWAEDH